MKAILVIDVDEKSIGREVNYIRVQGNGYSYIVKAVGENVRLRPLPQKKVGDDLYERYGSWTPSDEKEVYYRVGFNDCLDEILGETE